MRRKVTEQNDFLKKNKRKLKPFFSVSLCILRMMMMKKLLSPPSQLSQIEEKVVPKSRQLCYSTIAKNTTTTPKFVKR